jgi:hypothetical protein
MSAASRASWFWYILSSTSDSEYSVMMHVSISQKISIAAERTKVRRAIQALEDGGMFPSFINAPFKKLEDVPSNAIQPELAAMFYFSSRRPVLTRAAPLPSSLVIKLCAFSTE